MHSHDVRVISVSSTSPQSAKTAAASQTSPKSAPDHSAILSSMSPTPLITRSNDHILFLDYIRAAAIMLVFAYHALGTSFGLDQLEWKGWFRDFGVPRPFLVLLPVTFGLIGVPIFFVVSGFCIHLSFERSKRKDFGTFFTRRFFRIYPPYFLALAFFTFVFPWSKLKFSAVGDVVQLVTHVLMIHNFDERTLYAINPPFWSLAVEAQLYILYPLFLVFTRRLSWGGAIWVVGTIELALRSASAATFVFQWHFVPDWIWHSPFYYWFSWSIGARLADDWMREGPVRSRTHSLWIWPALALVSFFIRPLLPFFFLLVALSTASVIAFLLSHPAMTVSIPRLVSDHLRRVGVLSYSIYLLHSPILTTVPWALSKLFHGYHIHPIVTFGFCLAAWVPIVFFSWTFYQLAELPSIRMGKAIDSRDRRRGTSRAHASGSNAVPDRVPDPILSS